MMALRRSRRLSYLRVRILGRFARWMTVFSAIALVLAGVFGVAPRLTDWGLDMKKTDLFRLRTIQIDGVSNYRETDVRTVIKKQSSASLVGMDLEKIHEALMRLRWAKEVLLRKEWPDTLFVKVTERVPFAWVEDRAPAGPVDRMSTNLGMGHYRLVDEEGIELESLDHPVSDFPVIRWNGLPGISGHSQGDSSDSIRGELRAGLAALKAFVTNGIGSKGLAELVMEVRAHPEGRYDIRVQYQGIQLRLGHADPEGQIRRFLSLRPELLAEVPQVSELDLRFPGRLIVRSVEDKPGKDRAAIKMLAHSAKSERR